MKANYTPIAMATLVAALAGCAGITPPPAARLAALPVATYPAPPPAGDYVYRLPAGKVIDMRILVDGDALLHGVDQTVGAGLARDLYLYKQWASEDGQHWRPADELIAVKLRVRLPSYESPAQSVIHLTVDRPLP